jgi:hypothetical protein
VPCPVEPPCPSCPILPLPPTKCDGFICKKPKKDRLDTILERGVLRAGFPSVNVPGFTEYKNCSICDQPRPDGFLGCLLKSLSTAIFGKYSQSNTKTITNVTKLERLYYGIVDIDISYGVMDNIPKKVDFASASSLTVDVDAQFATTSPAIFISEEYYRKCDICKHLDIRGKLVRAIFKKLALYPETKEFVISAPEKTTEQDMLMTLIIKVYDYVKKQTGVNLVLASSDAGSESVGTIVTVKVLGETHTKMLDAVVGTDFQLLLREPTTILLTENDKKTYGLVQTTKHGLSFAYDVYGDLVNNKLKSVSNQAIKCLNLLESYEVHTLDDLSIASPILKYKISSDTMCHNILKEVGSMKTCTDEIVKNAPIDYKLVTHYIT